MRYDDIKLFDIDENQLNDLKNQLRFNEFCEWAICRLRYLIEYSTYQINWIDLDVSHLRNYRIKAITFYEQKKGH